MHSTVSLSSLHCLSAFSAFTTQNLLRPGEPRRVSIAFRRSPRSRPQTRANLERLERLVSIAFRRSPRSRRRRRSCLADRMNSLHCLSAFSAFTTTIPSHEQIGRSKGLHCLSAFSAFTTSEGVARLAPVRLCLHCL